MEWHGTRIGQPQWSAELGAEAAQIRRARGCGFRGGHVGGAFCGLRGVAVYLAENSIELTLKRHSA